MRTLLLGLSLAVLMLALVGSTSAQWRCVYATYDDDTNGTGHNTSSVGMFGEDSFVALVAYGIGVPPAEANYLIPYLNADSANGRLEDYGYGSASFRVFQTWSDGGFDQVQLFDAVQLAADKDSFIYVASNDLNHNILVFQLQNGTVTVAPVTSSGVYPRQETGTNPIYGIEVDADGYVYVCNDTSNGVSDDLKVYPPITEWTAFHTDSPVATLDLPDGIYKGITVSPDGSQLWVCDYENQTIKKYVGSRTTGYTLDPGFQFALQPDDSAPGDPLAKVSPLGLKLLLPNNILFAAVDVLYEQEYDYGRIYLINAGTGELVDQDRSVSMIDVAQWNFDLTGGYNDRTGGTVPGNASGYTSTYDVELDEAGNLYSLSFYGWTVEKWVYDGELPVVTSVEPLDNTVPGEYRLNQNYPNPFNPSTTIEFSLPASGQVRLSVYDLLGKEVATLVDEEMAPGSYRVRFDARNLPSGTYLYTLRGAGATVSQKMVLLK